MKKKQYIGPVATAVAVETTQIIAYSGNSGDSTGTDGPIVDPDPDTDPDPDNLVRQLNPFLGF